VVLKKQDKEARGRSGTMVKTSLFAGFFIAINFRREACPEEITSGNTFNQKKPFIKCEAFFVLCNQNSAFIYFLLIPNK